MNETRGLWRGKTTPKHNDEEFNSIWVEGDLIHSEKLCYIHPFANAVKIQGELGRLIVMHKVDPSTLGECTGLTDKNGKLIFEGNLCTVTAPHLNIVNKIGVVRYDTKCARFVIDFGKSVVYFENIELVEVIGNIHDNPELLKGDST